ncbi:MAG: hypothetical protein AVDCRST_MAG87-2194, partial [uncultured Thermomicrobiales bacterium]
GGQGRFQRTGDQRVPGERRQGRWPIRGRHDAHPALDRCEEREGACHSAGLFSLPGTPLHRRFGRGSTEAPCLVSQPQGKPRCHDRDKQRVEQRNEQRAGHRYRAGYCRRAPRRRARRRLARTGPGHARICGVPTKHHPQDPAPRPRAEGGI